MNMKQWNRAQIAEAMSGDNRWFFHLHYDREPVDDNELMMYYIEFGSEIFRQKHKDETYVVEACAVA